MKILALCLLSNKIKINLHMLGALMLNVVGG
jgi:hypothetical protein